MRGNQELVSRLMWLIVFFSVLLFTFCPTIWWIKFCIKTVVVCLLFLFRSIHDTSVGLSLIFCTYLRSATDVSCDSQKDISLGLSYVVSFCCADCVCFVNDVFFISDQLLADLHFESCYCCFCFEFSVTFYLLHLLIILYTVFEQMFLLFLF